MVVALIALATACTLTPAGSGGFATGASPTGGEPSTDTEGGGEETGDGTEDGGESGTGAVGESEGSGASTADPPDMTTGMGESSGHGESSSDDGAAQEGPACGQPGDILVQGSTGPANANQNCPTTAFTAFVAGNPGMVADIEVLLDATVATTSEFTATLQSPSGTTVVLFDQHGNSFTDDFIDTYFDDASVSPISGAAAPRSGCFAPDQALSAFDGEPAGGTWTLTVQTCLFAVSVDAWELRISH